MRSTYKIGGLNGIYALDWTYTIHMHHNEDHIMNMERGGEHNWRLIGNLRGNAGLGLRMSLPIRLDA